MFGSWYSAAGMGDLKEPPPVYGGGSSLLTDPATADVYYGAGINDPDFTDEDLKNLQQGGGATWGPDWGTWSGAFTNFLTNNAGTVDPKTGYRAESGGSGGTGAGAGFMEWVNANSTYLLVGAGVLAGAGLLIGKKRRR